MRLDEIRSTTTRKQAEAILKAIRDTELPAELDALKGLCDAADAPRLEKELLRDCCNEICRLGGWYLHLSPRAREKVGCPDILAMLNGKFYAVELKTRKGVVSEDQKRNLADLARNGAICAVIRDFLTFRNLIKTTKGEG